MLSGSVNIMQTGISIPNFIKDEALGKPETKSTATKYQSIRTETINDKKIAFQLRRNFKIEELQQIDDFCRQHLMSQPFL